MLCSYHSGIYCVHILARKIVCTYPITRHTGTHDIAQQATGDKVATWWRGAKCASQDMHLVLHYVFNRPGVAGAVLQTPSWFIHWVSHLLFKISSKHSQFQTERARELIFWENVHPTIYFMCHVSYVTCHMSHVTCQWRVCYQRGLPLLVFFW